MRNLFRISVLIIFFILIHSCKKDDNGDSSNTIKDIDGNVYTSVTIGTQVWLKENLKTTKYRNGDLIGTTTPATLDISGESEPKYQWACNGNESNIVPYGRLYTWYTVTDSRAVCPTGWHVPTHAEWSILMTYLGGESIAGGKLKETGTTHWIGENTDATNETGFTALPGGCREDYGYFFGFLDHGYWWSTTESGASSAFGLVMAYFTSNVSRYGNPKKYGFSVRCLKD